MNQKHIFISIGLFVVVNLTFSQNITQTIKGQVYDREAHIGLPGATVILPGTDPLVGVITDNEGYFVIDSISVGRVNLQISFIGYESFYINELLVSSGKEIVLEIPMKEKFTQLEEVKVKPEFKKEKALNNMATLSARTFSIEDAQRYAGGMDDPSRLVSSFAGVTPNTIENNEIVIRGNAAKGILWRLEGAEIPAPNHLAGLFSGGGVNTMFSSNMLANSDFFTSAFPAEYGNALSGVFDINLRSGNFDKREYTLQIGTTGIDLSTEGPFNNAKRSSYLINYRYSTYGLIQDLLPQVTGLPEYSDLSLKLSFPVKKAGTFSFWSINGMGRIQFENEQDTTEWETNMDSYEYDIRYNLTASGINHKRNIGNNSYLFSSVTFSGTEYINKNAYYRSDLQQIPVSDQSEKNMRVSIASYLNHKFNKRHANRTGFIINRLSYNYDVAGNTDAARSETYDYFVREKGSTWSWNVYSQSTFAITENINMKGGLQISGFLHNNEVVFEPRLGINWQVANRQTLSLAYGKHSRHEPLRIYLMEVPVNDNWERVNNDLDITKAHHLVLGYDVMFGQSTHLRIEPYYQFLFDVPVIPDSSFSMINYNNEMFFTSRLINTGKGRNTGIDLTLERFIKNGYYYMLTTSIYSSKYTGDDGIKRNTRYNQHYVMNILGGKEWQTRKNNTFSLNGKFTVLGGKRFAPVDEVKSIHYQSVIYDNTRIYEEQSPTNFYLDLSLNYTINKPRFSQSIILQAKNLLLQKEFIGHAYNYKSHTIEPYELSLIFPYLSYKVQF